MNKIALVYPRFKVRAEEISKLWGNQLIRGYKEIRKLGFDEDQTTLAVEAYQYLQTNPARVFIAGKVNMSVFLEACDLDGSKVVSIGSEDTSTIQGIHKALKEKNSVFVGVSNPISSDNRTKSILSGGAVAISISDGLKVIEYKKGKGSQELVPKYSENNFKTDGDQNRVLAQMKLHTGEGTHIYNYVQMRNIRRITPSPMKTVQTTTGYAGPLSPLFELVHWITTSSFGELVSISGADQNQAILLQLQTKGDIEVIKHDYSQYISYSKLIQRDNLENNPGSIAQGAYISTPVYQSNSAARYRLQANICTQCQSIEFPPRRLCKKCGSKTKQGPQLNKKGKLYSFTKILRGAAPTEFDNQQLIEGEYGVGIIEFPEGPKVIAQLSDVNIDELEISDEMQMVFRKIYSQEGEPRYGYKFIKA